MAIVVVGRVTKVVAKLEVWRRAADVVRDAADASQSLARVAVARSITQRLPPLPERVEDDGRHVDLHPAEQAEAEAPRLSSCPKADSRDTPAEAGGSDEQERFRMRVHALTTQPPPAPWTLHEPIGVGGLTGVGFGEVTGQDFLLVVSHDGRTVFDLDRTRVARDRTPLDDRWHKAQRLTAIGIGPLDGIAVPIAGLWGGGLPLMTGDGWTVERMPADWPHERIVLRASHPRCDEMIQVHHEALFEIRAVEFSPSATALVIASSGEFTLITR